MTKFISLKSISDLTKTVVAKSKLSFVTPTTLPTNIPLGKTPPKPVVVTIDSSIISSFVSIPLISKHPSL